MKFKRNLMTGLIGLALIAAPITAAAKDNDSGSNNSHQARTESRSNESHASAPSHNAAPAAHNEARPEHSARVETRAAAPEMNRNEQRGARVETRTAAPAVATRNDSRDGRTFNNAPVATEHRDVRVDRGNDGRAWNHDGNRDYRTYGHDYDHDDYDHDRDYAAGGWIMPRGYGGGACGWAQHLRNVYRHDEYTGHPAAAADLLGQMHRAERACGGVPYGYNTYRYPY
jgi:hypothetical protein